MNRLAVLLFIPHLVLGNTFPHSHGDVFAHDSRPHFHVGHGGHACCGNHQDDDHCHEEGDHGSEVPADHDSDAVYLTGGEFYLRSSDIAGHSVELEFTEYLSPPCPRLIANCGPLVVGHEAIFHDSLPLFMLHAALRL